MSTLAAPLLQRRCEFCGNGLRHWSMCLACRGRRISHRDYDFVRNPDVSDVLGLLARVVDHDPDYLPGVSSGALSLASWFTRKHPDWSRGVVEADSGHLVAFAGARINTMLPDRSQSPAGTRWEVGPVVVHPDHRGRGLATALLRVVASTFKDSCWISTRRDGPGLKPLRRARWRPTTTFDWPTGVAGSVFVPEPAETQP